MCKVYPIFRDLRQFLLIVTLMSEVLPLNIQLYLYSFVLTCRFYQVFGRFLLCCVWIGLDWIQFLGHQLDWTGLGSMGRGFGLDWILPTQSIPYSALVSSIHSAARDSGCARQSRPPKSWWTPSVSAARGRCRLWHRIWTECGRSCRGAVHDCYHQTRRTYRRTRKIAARSSIDQEAKLLHTLRNRNVPSFWKHVGRAPRQQQPAQCALDSEDFRIHFSDIHDDNGEQLSPSQRPVRDAVAERFSIGCNDAERRVASVQGGVIPISVMCQLFQ